MATGVSLRRRGSAALTQREAEVLRLVCLGYTNAEIAAELVLSVRTVESHRGSIRTKLQRPSKRELVEVARVAGLLADWG